MPNIDRIVKLNLNHGDAVQRMTDGKEASAQYKLQEIIRKRLMNFLDKQGPIKYNDEGIKLIRDKTISAMRGLRWDGSVWLHWRKDKRAENRMRKNPVRVITLYYSDVMGSSEKE